MKISLRNNSVIEIYYLIFAAPLSKRAVSPSSRDLSVWVVAVMGMRWQECEYGCGGGLCVHRFGEVSYGAETKEKY
jgi:hypothetical protein